MELADGSFVRGLRNLTAAVALRAEAAGYDDKTGEALARFADVLSGRAFDMMSGNERGDQTNAVAPSPSPSAQFGGG